LAALDLGSNSFHLITVRYWNKRFEVVDRMREMVRLAAGMHRDIGHQAHHYISSDTSEKALACLKRFAERLADFRIHDIRVVGTSALRKAHNAAGFIARAHTILGQNIEVISGREEARLIYLGACGALAAKETTKHLVIDIGGGSTELGAGLGATPVITESIDRGCVSISERYFKDGSITETRMRMAILDTRRDIAPFRESFDRFGRDAVIGTSGTIRSIANIAATRYGDDVTCLSATALKRLIADATLIGRLDPTIFAPLSTQRASVLPGGLAILAAVFRELAIDRMTVIKDALREGILYEMIRALETEEM